LLATRVSDRNGPVVSISIVARDEEVFIVSRSGILIRLRTREIPTFGRSAQGVRLMRLDDGDAVVSVARVHPDE
jgi:DNA gyrase subunit A